MIRASLAHLTYPVCIVAVLCTVLAVCQTHADDHAAPPPARVERSQLETGLIGSAHDFRGLNASVRDLCLPCHTPPRSLAADPTARPAPRDNAAPASISGCQRRPHAHRLVAALPRLPRRSHRDRRLFLAARTNRHGPIGQLTPLDSRAAQPPGWNPLSCAGRRLPPRCRGRDGGFTAARRTHPVHHVSRRPQHGRFRRHVANIQRA